jgi:hypothetical protein
MSVLKWIGICQQDAILLRRCRWWVSFKFRWGATYVTWLDYTCIELTYSVYLGGIPILFFRVFWSCRSGRVRFSSSFVPLEKKPIVATTVQPNCITTSGSVRVLVCLLVLGQWLEVARQALQLLVQDQKQYPWSSTWNLRLCYNKLGLVPLRLQEMW